MKEEFALPRGNMTEDSSNLGGPAKSLEATSGVSLDAPIPSHDPSSPLDADANPFAPPLVPSQKSPNPNDFRPCWYCGLAEAVGWFFGTLIVHLIGGIVGIVVVAFLRTGNSPARFGSPEVLVPLAMVEMSAFVIAAMLAVTVRFWGRTFRELNFSLPDSKHVAIVVVGAMPLSLCIAAWSLPIQWVWKLIVESYPALSILDQMNSMEILKDLGRETPFAILVILVAVMPAIGEELVFRGAMGRVLIANIGIWGGIILTSILFGMVHIHPVHAISVIPLGLAMHLLYLLTRSFWMPMLLHLLNNVWAVIVSQSQSGDPTDHIQHLSVFDVVQLASGGLATVMLGIVLWQSRVRFVRPDGEEWKSIHFPIRVPPDAEIQRRSAPVNLTGLGAAIGCAVVCNALVAFSLLTPAM